MGNVRKKYSRIPVAEPNLSGSEAVNLNEVISSGWLTHKGKFVEKFEYDFARYIGVAHAVACSSGTSALHLALHSLGVGPGDEVLIPDLTFVACANATLYCGATPIFCDVVEGDWTISINDMVSKITDKTKAVMAVHLYGASCQLQELRDICDYYELYLVEDCAQAIGTHYSGHHVGTIGDVSTFSFYGNKTITTGEGGMVCTNNAHLSIRLRHLINHAMLSGYDHTEMGFNYRMTNMQAAIGCAQMERIDEFTEKKKQIFKWYTSSLESKYMAQSLDINSTVPWMYTILLENRNEVAKELYQSGIETRPTFQTMSSLAFLNQPSCCTAAKIAQRGLSLPSGTTITKDEVDYIVQNLKECSERLI